MPFEMNEGWKRSIIAISVAGFALLIVLVINKHSELMDQCNRGGSMMSGMPLLQYTEHRTETHVIIRAFQSYNEFNIITLNCGNIHEFPRKPSGYMEISAYYIVFLLKWILPIAIVILGLRWVQRGFESTK